MMDPVRRGVFCLKLAWQFMRLAASLRSTYEEGFSFISFTVCKSAFMYRSTEIMWGATNKGRWREGASSPSHKMFRLKTISYWQPADYETGAVNEYNFPLSLITRIHLHPLINQPVNIVGFWWLDQIKGKRLQIVSIPAGNRLKKGYASSVNQPRGVVDRKWGPVIHDSFKKEATIRWSCSVLAIKESVFRVWV